MNVKVIKNLQTTIQGETIGSLIVNYDLKVSFDYPSDTHPDNLSNFLNEEREVVKINSVEYQIFDKVGVDISSRFASKILSEKLAEKVLEEIETEAIEDLVGGEHEEKFNLADFANNLLNSIAGGL